MDTAVQLVNVNEGRAACLTKDNALRWRRSWPVRDFEVWLVRECTMYASRDPATSSEQNSNRDAIGPPEINHMYQQNDQGSCLRHVSL